MSEEKHRFLFFKYVPEKRTTKPGKEVVAKPVDSSLPAESASGEVQPEFWPGKDHYDKPACPDEQYDYGPECPEDGYNEDPCADEDYPHEPECPEEEYPEEPECPEEEYPEEPECPEEEYPEEPECPEPEPDPCPANSTMHIVKRGDTYWKLAQRYNTTVEAIEAANPGVNPLNLQIGQELCIPLGVPGAKG